VVKNAPVIEIYRRAGQPGIEISAPDGPAAPVSSEIETQ
jgi:hypothetical protein